MLTKINSYNCTFNAMISQIFSRRLSAAEAQIGKLEAGLNSVESRVAQLQEDLAAHSRGAAELQLRSEATEAGLATSRALLHKLDAEHNDWQSQFETLTARKSTLEVEAANAASLLIYQVRFLNLIDPQPSFIHLQLIFEIYETFNIDII